jgi:hypothetical protein
MKGSSPSRAQQGSEEQDFGTTEKQMRADQAMLQDDLRNTIVEFKEMSQSEQRLLLSTTAFASFSSARKKLDFSAAELTVQKNPQLGVSAFLGTDDVCLEDRASSVKQFQTPEPRVEHRDLDLESPTPGSRPETKQELVDAIAAAKLLPDSNQPKELQPHGPR